MMEREKNDTVFINKTITGCYQILTAINCIIKGSYNEIAATNCTIKGDYNEIRGAYNTVEGDHNIIRGVNNSSEGHSNTLQGINSSVKGLNKPSPDTPLLEWEDSCKPTKKWSVEGTFNFYNSVISTNGARLHIQEEYIPANGARLHIQEEYIPATPHPYSQEKSNKKGATFSLDPKIMQGEDQETENERDSCKVCQVNLIQTVNQPCGHLILCLKCAKDVDKESSNKCCYLCRGPLTIIQRIYKG